MNFKPIRFAADGSPMITAEMTAEDKERALCSLGNLIRCKFLTVDYCDPLQENCYITSAGCYKGIYFPHSVILLKFGEWQLIALCKISKDIAALIEDEQENPHFIKIA